MLKHSTENKIMEKVKSLNNSIKNQQLEILVEEEESFEGSATSKNE